MPNEWMPGATRLDVGDHAPTDGGPAKAIGHITWDRNATAAKPAALVPYENLRDYFGKNAAGKAAAPHILWDPFTGRITQFVPASSRSKSLADAAGGTRTNRAGSVVIQVEALFFPYCVVGEKTYARLADTPCRGWAELLAWVRSWGVPDVWPMGAPKDFVSRRSDTTWRTTAGWYRHADVPENDHQDPGSWPAFADEEDDMTPEQDARLQRIEDALAIKPWTYRNKAEDDAAKKKGKRSLDAYGKLTQTLAATTANTAAIKTLAGLVGKNVDTAAVVAAVEAAIKDAVIKVDVDINGQEA